MSINILIDLNYKIGKYFNQYKTQKIKENAREVCFNSEHF